MGNVVEFPGHHAASGGYRSGRSSCRGTPVARSIGKTNSPGTPLLDRDSQYQTCDCVVPMRSAKGFCPPATSHARLSASVDDMSSSNANFCESQQKSLWATANLKFGTLRSMKPVDSRAFGARVRARRKDLGLSQGAAAKLAGYSQQHIGTIESGSQKHPERNAIALAEALQTTTGWLCYGEGPKSTGPQFLTTKELVEKYEALPAERKSLISRSIEEASQRTRKAG